MGKQAWAGHGNMQAPPAEPSPHQHWCSWVPDSGGCSEDLLLLSPAPLHTAHCGHTVTVSPHIFHLPAGAEASCEKAPCPGPPRPCLMLFSILVPRERHTVQSKGWNTLLARHRLHPGLLASVGGSLASSFQKQGLYPAPAQPCPRLRTMAEQAGRE